MIRRTKSRLEGLSPAIKAHILRLGFADCRAYFRWCRQNAYQEVLKKSLQQREAEIEVRERELRNRQEEARVHHNPVVFIREACHKRIQPEQVSRRFWGAIAETLQFEDEKPEFQSGLAEFLIWLHKKSDFCWSRKGVDALSPCGDAALSLPPELDPGAEDVEATIL
ncbi:MAG: hypothetical protein IPN28_12885 [Alphaproteobacteria bacterium]|nr:MAG: hypothetical protein IPN28_12885 [Alphaproteobacteria bacterium]